VSEAWCGYYKFPVFRDTVSRLARLGLWILHPYEHEICISHLRWSSEFLEMRIREQIWLTNETRISCRHREHCHRLAQVVPCFEGVWQEIRGFCSRVYVGKTHGQCANILKLCCSCSKLHGDGEWNRKISKRCLPTSGRQRALPSCLECYISTQLDSSVSA
jgi:hypothetical protein